MIKPRIAEILFISVERTTMKLIPDEFLNIIHIHASRYEFQVFKVSLVLRYEMKEVT